MFKSIMDFVEKKKEQLPFIVMIMISILFIYKKYAYRFQTLIRSLLWRAKTTNSNQRI